jgi:hypothetical protein
MEFKTAPLSPGFESMACRRYNTMDSNIEILDELAHRDIKIAFGQAREASRKETLIPVVISEFHTLMFHYPIVFVKDKETGQFTTSVLLGINAETNLLDG